MRILIFNDDLNTEEIEIYIGDCISSKRIYISPVVTEDIRKVVGEIKNEAKGLWRERLV